MKISFTSVVLSSLGALGLLQLGGCTHAPEQSRSSKPAASASAPAAARPDAGAPIVFGFEISREPSGQRALYMVAPELSLRTALGPVQDNAVCVAIQPSFGGPRVACSLGVTWVIELTYDAVRVHDFTVKLPPGRMAQFDPAIRGQEMPDCAVDAPRTALNVTTSIEKHWGPRSDRAMLVRLPELGVEIPVFIPEPTTCRAAVARKQYQFECTTTGAMPDRVSVRVLGTVLEIRQGKTDSPYAFGAVRVPCGTTLRGEYFAFRDRTAEPVYDAPGCITPCDDAFRRCAWRCHVKFPDDYDDDGFANGDVSESCEARCFAAMQACVWGCW